MNCTTIEQSKKLLELGLSPDSADILILNNVGRSGKVDDTNYTIILKENLNPLAKVPEIIPCWSVGALLELMPELNGRYRPTICPSENLCYFEDFLREELVTIDGDSLIEVCVQTVIWLLDHDYINKKV